MSFCHDLKLELCLANIRILLLNADLHGTNFV